MQGHNGKDGSGISPDNTFIPEVAAPLTKGSATGEGVNVPGRRKEDDENLVAFSFEPRFARNDRGAPEEEMVGPLKAQSGRSGRGDGAPMVFTQNQRDEVRDLDGVAGALNAEPGSHQDNYVAYNVVPESGQGAHLRASEAQVGLALSALNGQAHDRVTLAATAASVRRLTPTECERLQGFPDGWTQLGDTSDSRRYAALGDAVTVNVAEWLGRRLLAVDSPV